MLVAVALLAVVGGGSIEPFNVEWLEPTIGPGSRLLHASWTLLCSAFPFSFSFMLIFHSSSLHSSTCIVYTFCSEQATKRGNRRTRMPYRWEMAGLRCVGFKLRGRLSSERCNPKACTNLLILCVNADTHAHRTHGPLLALSTGAGVGKHDERRGEHLPRFTRIHVWSNRAVQTWDD